MRRAAKVDDNQAAIVDALRSMGYSVAVTSSLGKGFPDLVAGKHGNNYLIEVKDSSKPPSKRALTDDERAFHILWRGSIEIIESVQDVIAFDLRNR